MKFLVLITVISTALLACGEPEKKADVNSSDSQQPLQSKNSDSFNQSFEKLLTSYYSLKDALVEYDTVQANAASRKIAEYADSLAAQHFTNDSSGSKEETAKNYTGTITGSALGFVGETDIQNKKKEFQMISDAMYDLVRTVKYDRQTIYHQHCPMAFNDENEAYWLSNSSTIVNPYLGRKHPKYKGGMVGCGDVTDSLGYKR